MCGLAGYLSIDPLFNGLEFLSSSLAHIKNRGPDSSNSYCVDTSPFGAVHARLSVQDLSDQGSQPMISSSGRFVIVYNGEIYNFKGLRSKVDANFSDQNWRGNSDTEVLLKLIELYGLDKTLEFIDGMFAFAVWDTQSSKLYLCRDRFGEKPLYFSLSNKSLLFSSESKAIFSYKGFSKSINTSSLHALLSSGYISSPNSIFDNIGSIKPSSYLTISVKNGSLTSAETIYWDSCSVFQSSLNLRASQSFKDVLNELDYLLERSVRSRMVSDAPLGLFLSGGVDSSLILNYAANISSKPIPTFSVGFTEDKSQELSFSRHLSEKYSTDHHEILISSEYVKDFIQKMPQAFSEPFGDHSQVPSLIISSYAKKSVKVALTGDAADELFAGYRTYMHALNMWPYARLIPSFLKKHLKKIDVDPRHSHLYRFLPLAASGSREEFFSSLTSFGYAGGLIEGEYMTRNIDLCACDSYLREMMFNDTFNYLSDDILVKLDRSSMLHGLEARVPFLAKELVEFSWSLSQSHLLGDNGSMPKFILKELLASKIDNSSLIHKEKTGFSLPLNQWLLNDLRPWCEELIFDESFRFDGILNFEKTVRLWNAFVSGNDSLGRLIWNLLVFRSWQSVNLK